MERFRRGCTTIYSFLCFCHRFTIRKLSKYGYCQTILQSHNFWDANRDMFDLKQRTKETLPEIYMAGNFFTTICKTIILMFSLVIVYFLLIQQDEEFYLQNVLNLIVPLLVILIINLGDSFREQLNMQPLHEHYRFSWRLNSFYVHS